MSVVLLPDFQPVTSGLLDEESVSVQVAAETERVQKARLPASAARRIDGFMIFLVSLRYSLLSKEYACFLNKH